MNITEDTPSDVKRALIVYATLRDIYIQLAKTNALMGEIEKNLVNASGVIALDEFMLDGLTDTVWSSKLPSKVQSMRKEMAQLRDELAKRKKGLDWVDNLVKHTPETEPRDEKPS